MTSATLTGMFVVAAATGAVLGLRLFKVLVLIPTILVAAIGAILVGVITGSDSLDIVLGVVAIVVALQIGYLIGSLISSIAGDVVTVPAPYRSPKSLRAIQNAIAEGLRATFELPQELSPEMATLLTRLD
jgi:hypothetical protein